MVLDTKISNFTFSETCVVIPIREKDQQNVHFSYFTMYLKEEFSR
jgi:hypothetical protein